MQFSTKFTLFFVLCVCCLTVQAQPPTNGEPTSIDGGGSASRNSPWGKPKFNVGLGWQVRKTPKSNYSTLFGLRYGTVALDNQESYKRLTMPVLLRYHISDAVEVFAGPELGFTLSAKDAKGGTIPKRTATLGSTNLAGVIGIETGSTDNESNISRFRIGARFSNNILTNSKTDNLKNVELYIRIKVSKKKIIKN